MEAVIQNLKLLLQCSVQSLFFAFFLDVQTNTNYSEGFIDLCCLDKGLEVIKRR